MDPDQQAASASAARQLRLTVSTLENLVVLIFIQNAKEQVAGE